MAVDGEGIGIRWEGAQPVGALQLKGLGRIRNMWHSKRTTIFQVVSDGEGYGGGRIMGRQPRNLGCQVILSGVGLRSRRHPGCRPQSSALHLQVFGVCTGAYHDRHVVDRLWLLIWGR
ncbi:hypothetical protein PILCRDRAFT_827453 [Piloderma croceum F 1598]|uniref:Uncharacterized protein n=1 Tax=Piloderma croceum (strain F 1598) TaxID=765440 RepID=A0A0C3AMU6_PILCF|nr:hypothetical protein PILCRDRAFT_827453 [Piloderma croceum F 1598]